MVPQPDATARLALGAQAAMHEEILNAIGAPAYDTRCDRCAGPLTAGVWTLSRSQFGGLLSSWWICRTCDASLTAWWLDRPPPAAIGGT